MGGEDDAVPMQYRLPCAKFSARGPREVTLEPLTRFTMRVLGAL